MSASSVSCYMYAMHQPLNTRLKLIKCTYTCTYTFHIFRVITLCSFHSYPSPVPVKVYGSLNRNIPEILVIKSFLCLLLLQHNYIFKPNPSYHYLSSCGEHFNDRSYMLRARTNGHKWSSSRERLFDWLMVFYFSVFLLV